MCGGAIISDLDPPSRSSRCLTADLLWNTALKKNPNNYYSKPLRSEFVDLDDDFEADFQGFKDFSEYEADVKPFAFSASKQSGITRGKPLYCYVPKVSFIYEAKTLFFFFDFSLLVHEIRVAYDF